MFAQDASAERPAVHLGRAVVDAERAHVAEDALDHGVARDAEAAQDLHERSTTRAIASEQITLAIELSFEARSPWSSTQAVCQIASRAGVDVHLVVGQHERHALVLAELLAERLARAGVVGGDVVRAAAEPSQRMQCVSRAGASRTWA